MTTTLPALLATDLMAWMESLPLESAYVVIPTPTEVPQPVIPGWDVNVLQVGMQFKVVARRGSLVSIAEKLTADQVMTWDPAAKWAPR